MSGELAAARVVGLPGELDESSGASVTAALAEGLAAGATVIADLTALAFCSLEGLAVLLGAHRAVAAAGGQLRLAGAGPAVRRLLERTGASRVLALYPDVAAARDGQAVPAAGLVWRSCWGYERMGPAAR